MQLVGFFKWRSFSYQVIMHAAGDLDMQGNCWNGSGLKMDFKVIKHSVQPPPPWQMWIHGLFFLENKRGSLVDLFNVCVYSRDRTRLWLFCQVCCRVNISYSSSKPHDCGACQVPQLLFFVLLHRDLHDLSLLFIVFSKHLHKNNKGKVFHLAPSLQKVFWKPHIFHLSAK